MATPGVADVITIAGYSLLDALVSSNSGPRSSCFEPWEERTDARNSTPSPLRSN